MHDGNGSPEFGPSEEAPAENLDGVVELLQALVSALQRSGSLNTAQLAPLLAALRKKERQGSTQQRLIDRMLMMLAGEPQAPLRRTRIRAEPAQRSPSATTGLLQGKLPAPIGYMLHLERGRFPITVTETEEIAHVRALSAAGFIEASIPPRSTDRKDFGTQPPITVWGLTRQGRLEVQRLDKLKQRH